VRRGRSVPGRDGVARHARTPADLEREVVSTMNDRITIFCPDIFTYSQIGVAGACEYRRDQKQ
jgi:hypothetical protein